MTTHTAMIAQEPGPAQSPPGGGGFGSAISAFRFACALDTRANWYFRNWQDAAPMDINRAWRAFCAAHDVAQAAMHAAYGRRA